MRHLDRNVAQCKLASQPTLICTRYNLLRPRVRRSSFIYPILVFPLFRPNSPKTLPNCCPRPLNPPLVAIQPTLQLPHRSTAEYEMVLLSFLLLLNYFSLVT